MVKICIQLEVFAYVVLLHWFLLDFIWDLKTSMHDFCCFCFWFHMFISSIHPSIYPSFYLWLSASMALKNTVKSAIQFWDFY